MESLEVILPFYLIVKISLRLFEQLQARIVVLNNLFDPLRVISPIGNDTLCHSTSVRMQYYCNEHIGQDIATLTYSHHLCS